MRVIGSEWKDSTSEANGGTAGDARRFVLRYFVMGDHESHTRDEILAVAEIPAAYSAQHGGIARSHAIDFGSAAARLYIVDVTFDSRMDSLPQVEKTLPPEQRRPEWFWRSETVDEVMEVDADDPAVRIETGAFDPILVTRPRAIPVLTISKLQPVFDPNFYFVYQNHVNLNPFWGAPPGCALMFDAQDEEALVQWNEQTLRYRRVTYVIKFNARRDEADNLIGWKAHVLSQGEHYLDLAEQPANQSKLFKDADRRKRLGNVKPDGTDGGANSYWLTFNRFPKRNFGPLQLGPFV